MLRNSRKFNLFDRWRGAFGRWATLAKWLNTVAQALNRAHSLSPLSSLEIGPDGGLEHDFDESALLRIVRAADPEPFRITLEDSTHYSVAAGRVRMRGAAVAVVAKVDGTEITADRWLYVPITISTGGSLTVGAIAESATEPLYWGRDGSNQTVIQRVVGKIAVGDGGASIDYNTTGDIDLFDQLGQTVAPSAENNPVYLAAAFADTGSYDSDLHELARLDGLHGAVPSQKLRIYVPKASPPDWPDLANPPVKILCRDSEGNKGWVAIEEFECPED